MDEVFGDKLLDGKYSFVKHLGEGGFGTVFLAKELVSEELVAIKKLKGKLPAQQKLIIREIQFVSKFNHPNITQYKHHFFQDGQLYLVMEYCPLGSLRDYIGKERITSSFTWKWFETLAETMMFVHEKGIVHHDIKPDNILFTSNREIKLTDFGVANSQGGTRSYQCPETFDSDHEVSTDPRVDIYALGVTLIEVLTKKNPFAGKSISEIISIHETKNYGINNLPNWQQEIILKSIALIPENRFQTMADLREAIQSKSVPIIFDKEVVLAGELAEKASIFIEKKKWSKAFALLNYAEQRYKPNVNVILQSAKYFLRTQQISKSKVQFEKALKWNPRIDIQKELGWINLELKNYPLAISLLSDHLHRTPSDYEAYNLLLQCYYETNRYETAMSLAEIILGVSVKNNCFANNYYLCQVLLNGGSKMSPETILINKSVNNHFLDYNHELVFESKKSHSFNSRPTLKSKFLFMDYRFNDFKTSKLYFEDENRNLFEKGEFSMPIIKIGRHNFDVNDIRIADGPNISRRHCVIVNCKDDIWIYDLGSTGTYVNNSLLLSKVPIIGRNTIRIEDYEFTINTDKNKLL